MATYAPYPYEHPHDWGQWGWCLGDRPDNLGFGGLLIRMCLICNKIEKISAVDVPEAMGSEDVSD